MAKKLKAILICEDDEKIQNLFSLTLSNYKNEKLTFKSGRKAIEYVEGHPGDVGLIFLDIGLEDMNGYDVLKQIREDCKSKVPVVIVSAYVSKDDISKGIRLGANHYLVKPFNLKKIYDICADYLEKEK